MAVNVKVGTASCLAALVETVGRSAQAKQATISHTASLTGSDASADALLSRLGIARVDGLTEMMEALKIINVSYQLLFL